MNAMHGEGMVTGAPRIWRDARGMLLPYEHFCQRQ